MSDAKAKIIRLLKDISDLERGIKSESEAAAEKIQKIRTKTDKSLTNLRSKLELMKAELASFTERNRDTLLGDAKSLKIGCGTVGFRSSTTLEPTGKRSWESVFNSVKSMGIAGSISVRESLNKAALKGWDEDPLKKVGLRKVVSDKFFYKVAE